MREERSKQPTRDIEDTAVMSELQFNQIHINETNKYQKQTVRFVFDRVLAPTPYIFCVANENNHEYSTGVGHACRTQICLGVLSLPFYDTLNWRFPEKTDPDLRPQFGQTHMWTAVLSAHASHEHDLTMPTGQEAMSKP